MKNSKAIIFDLGGVILNINYQNTIDEFLKLGVAACILLFLLFNLGKEKTELLFLYFNNNAVTSKLELFFMLLVSLE